MEEETKKKLARIAMMLCAAAGVLSLVIFIPQVREMIIGLGERYVGRPLTHEVWHGRFIKWELLFLACAAAAFMGLRLIVFAIQQHIDVYSLFQARLKTVTDEAWAHYVALTVFVFVLCVLHFCLVPSGDDVNYFNHVLQDTAYLDFLKSRYDNWSFRLIIETALVNCYAFNFGLWRFLEVVALVVIAETLVYICVPQKKYAVFVYAVVLFCTDWHSLHSAGWGATTVNYLWPLAASMPAFVIAKKIHDGLPISKKAIVGSLPFLVFATNQEQVCAWLFGLSLSFLLYRIVKNRRLTKNDSYIIISVLICAASLVFILTCPGNNRRFIVEINSWFPQYTSLSFFEKVQLGVLTIFTYYYSLRSNMVIVPLCILLTVVLRAKSKRLFFTQVILDVFIPLNAILRVLLGEKWLLANNKLPQFADFSSLAVICECAFLLIVGIMFLCQIVVAFGTKSKGLCNAFLLIAGFCSAFIIAFSPTVYASGSRCYLFLSYTMFFVAFNLMSDYFVGKQGEQVSSHPQYISR